MNETEKQYQEHLHKFYFIYSQMLSNENWKSTPLLKLYHAKLSKLAEDFSELANITGKTVTVEDTSERIDRAAYFQSRNMQLVFIHLYTSDGKSLEAWGRLVSNLSRQYVSRPIYEEEYDAQSAAQATPVLFNVGYAAIWVDKNAILRSNEGPELKDKLGKPLLTLKDRAIDINNLEYFWNNYMLYQWRSGKLEFDKLAEKIIK